MTFQNKLPNTLSQIRSKRRGRGTGLVPEPGRNASSACVPAVDQSARGSGVEVENINLGSSTSQKCEAVPKIARI